MIQEAASLLQPNPYGLGMYVISYCGGMKSIPGFYVTEFALVRLKLEYDSMTWDNADDQHRQADLGAAQEHAQRTIDSTTNRLLEERTVLGSADMLGHGRLGCSNMFFAHAHI